MALSSVEQLRELFKKLNQDDVRRIILFGKPGVGKTWMARKLSDLAVKNHLFDFTLWVFLNINYNSMSLQKSIARQLSLLSTCEEWEGEDDNKDTKNKEEEENRINLETKIAEALAGKKFLLILDDEGRKMNEEVVMSDLKNILPSDKQGSHKVLITTRADRDSDHIPEGTKIGIEPLSDEDSLSLLKERTETNVYKFPGIKQLAKDFIPKSRGLPGDIFVIAKALSYFGQHNSGLRKLESALKEAFDNENYHAIQLLCSGYDPLPIGVLIDCFWHGSHFFRDYGSIHYNGMITYWILEGYLGHAECIEEAYEKGHHVLMELIDCQMLRKLDAGYIVLDGPKLDLDEHYRRGFCGSANLGLATVVDDKWEAFGGMTWTDGMIKTQWQDRTLRSLLLDGNHFDREALHSLLQSEKQLEVLALLNPTFKSLPSPLSLMDKLRVLVLRGCKFLEEVNKTLDLKRLNVLEISGSNSLETIPTEFFMNMPQLQSLNLSGLQMKSLPSSIYNLSELRWLVLRGCSCLVKLESLSKLTNLMVLDLSGAISLTIISDKSFEKNSSLKMIDLSESQIINIPLVKNLGELTHLLLSGCTQLNRLRSISLVPSLQILDLSGASNFKEFHDTSLENLRRLKILDLSRTAIEKLPSNISSHYLYLKGCSRLKNLPSTEALKDLKVLDLSGLCELPEIGEEFFKRLISLRVLNLSETNVKILPSLASLCNLRQLLLSCCTSLVKLPELNSLAKLEVLDLSESSDLKELQDKSFEQLSRLQRLDLSQTNIANLPPLSNSSILQHLLLKNCNNLKILPPLTSLSQLEELNFSGVCSLKETGVDFLKYMSSLQILDLSDTLIEQLPPLSNLKNLIHLSLRGCKCLETVPDLEKLTKLEVLDLSATRVRHLPSLDSFFNLRQLLLSGCSGLVEFQHLEMLDLLGATVKQLPYGISKLIHLERLDLPNMKNIQEVCSSEAQCLPKEENRNQWIIFSLPPKTLNNNERPPVSVSGSQFLQVLKKNSSLWETSFKKFHFCVHPLKSQNKESDRHYRNQLISRDICFQTSQFAELKGQRSLQIHAFHHFPEGIGNIVSHIDCLFLIDNTFKNWLSELGASNLKEMKGCWIERCTEMESVFHEREAEDIAELGKVLDLAVSNAIKLKSIYSENLPCDSFQNLRSLYLDCCPELSTAFSASQLPENLKFLQIRFCSKLKTLFESEPPSPPQRRLPNLEMLHLWELPELRSIGCTLPSLQILKVWECPKLQNLEEHIKLAGDLHTLWISNVVELKSVYSGNEGYKNLRSLTLENCPMLVDVFSSPQPPENLENLQIKSCEKLESVFGHGTSVDYTLPKLRAPDLLELPKLKSIGCKFPSLQDHPVMENTNCEVSQGGMNRTDTSSSRC